ncbi:MAG: hypothetical protein KatS3mg105_0012 [Gemmatales bacterium]|nr:MAG: hypothetical protein KatS3mg105_0012 [Gemmatales bacterium]
MPHPLHLYYASEIQNSQEDVTTSQADGAFCQAALTVDVGDLGAVKQNLRQWNSGKFFQSANDLVSYGVKREKNFPKSVDDKRPDNEVLLKLLAPMQPNSAQVWRLLNFSQYAGEGRIFPYLHLQYPRAL